MVVFNTVDTVLFFYFILDVLVAFVQQMNNNLFVLRDFMFRYFYFAVVSQIFFFLPHPAHTHTHTLSTVEVDALLSAPGTFLKKFTSRSAFKVTLEVFSWD